VRKKGPICNAVWKAKTPKGLSEKDLCVLRFLSVHPLVFMRGEPKERKELDSQKEKRATNRRDTGGRREDEIGIQSFLFLVFGKKRLCGLCVLCG